MIRSMENVTRERRLGGSPPQGGDVYVDPDSRRGQLVAVRGRWRSLVYQELSPDGKTRDIKLMKRDALPRVLWRDHDERWLSPTSRDSEAAGLTRRQVSRVRQRSQRLDSRLRDAGERDVRGAGEAARRPATSAPASAAGRRTASGSRITTARPATRWSASSTSSTSRPARARPIVTDTRRQSRSALLARRHSQLVFQRTDLAELAGSLRLRRSRAGAALVAPQRLDARRPESRPISSRPSRCRFRAVSTRRRCRRTLMVPKNLDKIAQAPGDRLDSRLGIRSELPRLASRAATGCITRVSQYLAQQGYVMLTPDYRGSSGYSRDWSTGVHMGVGVNDTADVARRRRLSEDARLRRSRSHRRVGTELRRLPDAAGDDRGSDAVARRHRRRRRR